MSKNDMDDEDTSAEGKPELQTLLGKSKKSRTKHGGRRCATDSSGDDWPVDLLPPKRRIGAYFCRDFQDFTWRRHKVQVLCVSATFTVLLILALLMEIQQQQKLNLAILVPWLLCICLSFLLLYLLCSDYDRSRLACSSVSPVLILMACFSWYMPDLFCGLRIGAGPCKVEHQPLNSVFLVSILPLLLCYAPVMGLHVACGLSGLILGSAAIYQSGMRGSQQQLSSQALILSPIVFISSVTLSYQSYRSERELFLLVSSWRKTLWCSKREAQEAKKELDNVKRDSSDRIAKMRQFISYIFHEIRVPFNAVVLGIGHLLATNVSEEQQEVLKMMDSSSSSMIRILNDVLDMGKIESGKLQLEKQGFNLAELVSSLIWAFKDTLESKGLDFSLCVDECTKEFLSTHDLVGDKHRIRQVLANYLSNATKFTPRGGKVKLHIVWNRLEDAQATGDSLNTISHLHQEAAEGKKKYNNVASVTVSVEDTGIGISKEDQARLFEPYMQIHAGSTQAHGGTGLGLSFAKRIVELAGGRIGVFSDIGKGSVFFFTIPFEVAGSILAERKVPDDVLVNPFDLPGENRIEANGSTSNGLSSLRQGDCCPKVLIVEDNQVNRSILKKLLASFRIESDAVEDGQQAVELCRSGAQYDMILIDKEMPVMDGHEATREIRAMGIKTTIVGLTGNALDSDRNQFLAAGVNDFFTKPLSRHQLLKLLKTHGLVAANS